MADGPEITPGGPEAVRGGSRRGRPGFFHLAQQPGGQWSLFDPAGAPVFLRAVHGVRSEPADTDAVPGRAPAARLRAWGFNAVGVEDDGSGRDDGLPFLAEAGFCSAAAGPIVAPGVRLPDVFAPDWTQRALQHAARTCAPLAETRELVGWVTDGALAWGAPAGSGQPGLLQACLSLEPGFAAYHAAWEFVLALHGGRLDHVARAWGVPLANKEVVRDMTRSEAAVGTRGYGRDEARWTREFATRYFAAVVPALRNADPNHLVCGPRLRAPVGAVVLGAAIAVDLPLAHWAELPAPGAPVGPVLAGDVAWVDPRFDPARRPARLTSIEWMLRRGRAALGRLARHPAVVGYVWRQWLDDPGEQPPFAHGLLHLNGSEAREHTEVLTDFNFRAEALRRSAAKQLTA